MLAASALGATFRSIARRKSAAQAVFVIARKLAISVYRLLRHGQAYSDIGQDAYEARHRARRLKALAANAKDLGFDLVPAGQAA